MLDICSPSLSRSEFIYQYTNHFDRLVNYCCRNHVGDKYVRWFINGLLDTFVDYPIDCFSEPYLVSICQPLY